MTDSEENRKSKCHRLFVAAIDFGTTYSGYAFSSKDNWAKVITNHVNLSGGNQISQKAPTALLLNPDKTFKAFGYEAEQQYANLASDDNNNCKKFYFFQKFKLILKTDFEHVSNIFLTLFLKSDDDDDDDDDDDANFTFSESS